MLSNSTEEYREDVKSLHSAAGSVEIQLAAGLALSQKQWQSRGCVRSTEYRKVVL